MRTLGTFLLGLALAGCSTRPCVDGQRTSSGYFGGSTRVAYDPCPQKCCAPDWTRGCACSDRCPCVARHPK
ncbi:MAG: hypothetical protein JO332_01035 [Planctomycetaceae bacterium]|nr:hypothetical protein [Planctomycetaceae bacterium]